MTAPGSGIEPAYATALPAPMGGALPTSLEWQALHSMAQTLAASDVIPYRLKRKPDDVAVILLAAREYGIPPLMALSKLPVVNGTPAPMGELMVALVLRAGHSIRAKVYNEDGSERKGEGARQPITEGTYAECVTLRRDEAKGDEDVLTFTIAEALSAGLVERLENGRTVAAITKNGKAPEPTPWQQYPDNMLRWRAVANACRLRFPDVLLGLSYLPEELGAIVDAEGAPIDGTVVEPPPARRAAAGTVEERTAQEAAGRALEWTGDPAVLTGPVLEHAEANGYADAAVEVDLGSGARQRLPLRELLPIVAERLAARTVEQAATVAQEAATAPQAPPAPEAPAEPAAAPTAPPAPVEDPLGDLVYFATTVGDVDVIRDLYREHKPSLTTLVVAPAELAGVTLVPDASGRVQLGAVLMALANRLAAGKGPLVLPGPPDEDPRDEAGAWPDQPDAHPDELPLSGE